MDYRFIFKKKKPKIMSTTSKSQKGTYWYRIYIGECPVCGRNKSYRERVYGPRPQNRADRYVWLLPYQTYDGCIG